MSKNKFQNRQIVYSAKIYINNQTPPTMKQQSVIEGNRAIAEFMELETCTDPDHVNDKCYAVPYAKGYHRAKQLQYHSSWDWLMPVVEKIEKLSGDEQFQVQIIIGDCYISTNNSGIYFQVVGNKKIDSVWQAIIQFIQWYNTYNPSTPKP